jgi:glutamyl-tRNA reductase
MPIYVFGMNHQTAPLAVREQVAVTPEQLPQALATLRGETGLSEAVILSTCNRTEVYAVGDPHSERLLGAWLVRQHALDPAALIHHCYSHVDQAAVRHTLRVACGLDSMVLGEPQILGQIKTAYQAAVEHGATGKQINKLMQYAFAIAKKVRTETAIGANPVSVAYAAVRLARQVHGDLHERRALLVGAGDTIELVAQHLTRQGLGGLVIANRTLARATMLAQSLGGRGIALEGLPAELVQADIVVTSATSREPLVTREMLARAIKARHFKPVFIVDLAVPRNVDPGAATLDDIYLYTVDDLNQVITENLEIRQAAAKQAEEIVEARVTGFMDWMQSLDGNALIVSYRRQVEAVTEQELDRARRRLANGDDVERVLAGLGRAIANKLVHAPLTCIRQAATDGRSEIIEAARELLAVDDDPAAP